jgi:BolA family transcriptional regulator, general stress-responsive regulator
LTAARTHLIRERLQQELQPDSCQVVDESHLHVGHAGARDGRGHFRVEIVSRKFSGLSSIARHRLVYQALGSLMETDIHALSIQATPPPT